MANESEISMAVLAERIEHMFEKLETHISEEEEYRRTLEKRVEKQDQIIELLTKETTQLTMLVERYKGAVGLLTLLGSCLAAGYVMFKDFLFIHIR